MAHDIGKYFNARQLEHGGLGLRQACTLRLVNDKFAQVANGLKAGRQFTAGVGGRCVGSHDEGKAHIVIDLPIFLDSPLAIKATEIFRRYRSYLDSETQALLKKGEDPLELPQLKFSSTTAQSMEINVMKGPAIVISASGMANAGRIKHHLKHNLWRPGASIVFVGFQAAGTPGRRIVDGAKTIRFFGEDISVKAKVFTIGGFSAHAGQDQLLEWLTNFQNKKMQIFLVHGEISAQDKLASLIREKLDFAVTIPEYLEEINLQPGAAVQEVKKPAQ